jgi:hypothetical protein
MSLRVFVERRVRHCPWVKVAVRRVGRVDGTAGSITRPKGSRSEQTTRISKLTVRVAYRGLTLRPRRPL